MGVEPDRCGEQGAEPEGKAFDLPADLRSIRYPWSWASGSDWKNKTADRVSSGGEQGSTLGRSWSGTDASLRWKEQTKVVSAFG